MESCADPDRAGAGRELWISALEESRTAVSESTSEACGASAGGDSDCSDAGCERYRARESDEPAWGIGNVIGSGHAAEFQSEHSSGAERARGRKWKPACVEWIFGNSELAEFRRNPRSIGCRLCHDACCTLRNRGESEPSRDPARRK